MNSCFETKSGHSYGFEEACLTKIGYYRYNYFTDNMLTKRNLLIGQNPQLSLTKSEERKAAKKTQAQCQQKEIKFWLMI